MLSSHRVPNKVAEVARALQIVVEMDAAGFKILAWAVGRKRVLLSIQDVTKPRWLSIEDASILISDIIYE